jgi:hypothetical protein
MFEFGVPFGSEVLDLEAFRTSKLVWFLGQLDWSFAIRLGRLCKR